MQGESINIFQGFLIGTLLILVFVFFLVLFVVVYKQRQNQQERRLLEIETQYQRDLLAAAVASQERERERIARDLHDEIGAMLSTVNLGLLRFQRKAERGSSAEEFSQRTKALIDSTADQVRRISRDLLPATLGRFGLKQAVGELMELVEGQSGMEVKWEVDEVELGPEQALGLYRIVQEAANNTLKHAEAGKMELRLWKEAGEMRLFYRDDGKGFAMEEVERRKSLGLSNIETRASVLGGRGEIKSRPGEGTWINVVLPLGINRLGNTRV